MNMLKTYLGAVIVALILIWLLAGCRTTKEVQITKTVTDSTYYFRADSLTRVVAYYGERLSAEEVTRRRAGIQFWPGVPVDTTWEPTPGPGWGDFGPDSGGARLIKYTDGPPRNWVVIGADGRVAAGGNIAAVNLDEEASRKEIKEVERRNDSLSKSNQELKVELEKSQTVKDKTVVKERGRGLWWLWLLVGAVGGWFSRQYMSRFFK